MIGAFVLGDVELLHCTRPFRWHDGCGDELFK